MTAPTLFDTGEHVAAPGPLSGLFADIVFDRPLDHAFTYAVPESLAGKVGVGKRVEAPLGRGGKPPPGSASASPTRRRPRRSRSSRSRACSTTTPSSMST